MKNSFRILVLAQDASIRDLVADILSPHFEISTACDVLQATDHIGSRPHHMLILDPHLPVVDGVEYVRIIRHFAEYDSLSSLALSSYPPHIQQLGNHIQGALAEPFVISDLLSLVHTTLERTSENNGPDDRPGGSALPGGDNSSPNPLGPATGASMLKAVVFCAWAQALVHRSLVLTDRASIAMHSAFNSRNRSRVIRSAARSARESRTRLFAAPLGFSPN